MTKHFALAFLFALPLAVFGQAVDFTNGWKFATGDNPKYASPDFDDSDWKSIKTSAVYEVQGFTGYDGYSWYRIRFKLPSKIRNQSFLKDSILVFLAKIDDSDAAYLNGVKFGQTGTFPDDASGYVTRWNWWRRYTIPTNHPALRWDAENVVAVRVYDGGGAGGIFGGECSFDMLDLIDFIKMEVGEAPSTTGPEKINKKITVKNANGVMVEGSFQGKITRDGKILKKMEQAVQILAGQEFQIKWSFPRYENAREDYTFIEKKTGKILHASYQTPYILTPKESPKPRINTPAVYGVRPNRPFQFYVATTGQRPMNWSASGLPEGLHLEESTGIITGKVVQTGDFEVTLTAKNALGTTSKQLKISIGDKICLTPPMGWNSWNCWGLSVSDEKVRASAAAMVKSGLINHGWTYMNLDDGWEAPERAPNGEILCNEKFPDMKALADHIHGLGLKIGIYSSPGPTTCGGFLGSYQHESQDAATYAKWGIDYLKYDWCSYGDIAPKNPNLAEMKKPYTLIHNELRKQNRDIVLSLCQYGMGDVWKWGTEVGGQLWRTTGDIEDSWESLAGIGFSQNVPAPYSKPGGWNDPDMMIVGWVGWGKLHQTRLTPDEQYTHVSLWALLSAPLLIGCDLSRIDDFTYNLLANDEVIAIDQDPLGQGAAKVVDTPEFQIWVKKLADGSKAVGIFNLSETEKDILVDWTALGIVSGKTLRDVWRQSDLGKTVLGETYKTRVQPHGVTLLVVR